MLNRSSAFLVCAVLAAVALPLVFQLVDQNRYYGLRTAATMADSAAWFSANRFLGAAIFIASLVSALCLWLMPYAAHLISDWFPLALVAVPLIGAVGATFMYLRNFMK